MTGWADFRNPDWGVRAICETDEAFRDPASIIGTSPGGLDPDGSLANEALSSEKNELYRAE